MPTNKDRDGYTKEGDDDAIAPASGEIKEENQLELETLHDKSGSDLDNATGSGGRNGVDGYSKNFKWDLTNGGNANDDDKEDLEEAASIRSTDAILEVGKSELNDAKLVDESGPTEEELRPELQRFMVACQHGDLDVVKQLISDKFVRADETFSDGITGLHWAAINDRLAIVEYLVTNEHSGSDPNVVGGDLKATPLHWACRNGLVYIVDYLIQNTNADPSLKDGQSYNALHLAVHSSNILLVTYLIYTCCTDSAPLLKRLYIDEEDNFSRTALHWAAYQCDILSVNALIKNGADVNKTDKTLFIPLHWAFMRGYKNVLLTLVEAGSNIFAMNDQGKNSFDISKDMNCFEVWNKVLLECDRDPKNNWEKKQKLFDPKYAKLITFFSPYVLLPIIFQVCSFSNGQIITKLLVSIAAFLVTVYSLQKLIIPMYIAGDKALTKSPFLAGIFSGALCWCVLVWMFKILPLTFLHNPLTNIVLSVLMYTCIWSFVKAMFMNPGFVPIPTDNSVIANQIRDLIQARKFDSENFCTSTFVRKPIRSRYSRVNRKLIARFDHYCPWTYNEVGVRNHKVFMIFVYSLVVAVIFFIYLSIELFDQYKDQEGYTSDDEAQKCWLNSEDWCEGYNHHHFHYNLLIFALLNFIWLAFLSATQTFQILRGLTTWEFSQLNSRNRRVIPHDRAGTTTSPSVSYTSGTTNTNLAVCMKLLGLDHFILASKISIRTLLNKNTGQDVADPMVDINIPSDYGLKMNWLDFWFLGTDVSLRNLFYLPIEGENRLNGQIVDYYRLYEYPPKSAQATV